MKTYKLPRGAVILKHPLTKKVGGWVVQTFDAKIILHGITWYRVKDGMGGQGDREDWVADIPVGCVSVHDYQWRPPYFGFERYRSFFAAVIGAIVKGRDIIQHNIEDLTRKIHDGERALRILNRSIKQSQKQKR